MRSAFSNWGCLSLFLACSAGPILLAGCRLAQTVANVPGQAVHAVTPGKKDTNVVDAVEVQQGLLRFADEFSTRMAVGVDKLQRGTNLLSSAEALQWKIAFGIESCSIASGGNTVANLVDMTVFVTLTRTALEEYWQPKVFGSSALPLLESCRIAEREIWELAGIALKPEQQLELRDAISRWRRENPLPEGVLAARALGFADQIEKSSPEKSEKPDSLFRLLKVDPLAGVDPAVRELAETRMFAERALYVTQRMPILLRWQAELLSINAMEIPAVRQLISNSTQIAASVDRFAVVAEKLPAQVSTEREEILKSLQSQEKEALSLLKAGTEMSDSLQATLMTFDGVMKRLGLGATNASAVSTPNAEPFRIRDYTATASQLEMTAEKLTELLVTLDAVIASTNLANLSAQFYPAVQKAQSSSKEVVDYAFWKAILVVGAVLLAALIYRFLSVCLSGGRSKSIASKASCL